MIVSKPTFKATAPNAVWSPKPERHNLRLDLGVVERKQTVNKTPLDANRTPPPGGGGSEKETVPPVVWQPFGEPMEIPQFRSIKRDITITTKGYESPTAITPTEKKTDDPKPQENGILCDTREQVASRESDSNSPKLIEDQSSETTSSLVRSARNSNLPPSQSPTITLLQKAREGQIPKGAIYIGDKIESKDALLPKGAVLIDQKVTIEGDKVHTDSYYALPISGANDEKTTHVINAPAKYDGIGPTEYGIPVGLRTGVKDEYASDWYKTMYRSLHKNADHRGHTLHLGGYMSEPEYDKRERRQYSSSLEHRRKTEKPSIKVSQDTEISPILPETVNKELVIEVASEKPRKEPYRNQPRSIASYEPGRSSLADQEFQKFWDDFWDSLEELNEHFRFSPRPMRSYEKKWPNAILDGYESDSTLIRKSVHPTPPPDPEQQKVWYREIQKGGEIPFTGLRKLAPAKPKESLHQYQETEVNIHYKSPIRNLEKESLEEEELRLIQEESMRQFYTNERLKKQQQQIEEIEKRRHCDNFIPSQKSPIPLNRYENPFDGFHSTSPDHQRTLAQVLYPFVAQSSRELNINKGDIVYITRQIDKNWYEGEHHGFVGIFPVSYVTVIPMERTNFYPKDLYEGYGRVRYNFRAKTPIELSLFKGEIVILIRRVDYNWYEGRLGNKKGIFPASYIDVIQQISGPGYKMPITKLSSSPFSTVTSTPVSKFSHISQEAKPYQEKMVPEPKVKDRSLFAQSLHVDIYNEPIPYRSLYSYAPQNEDELELHAGDTVYVMEKCDDGWYVGTSLRTGLFGTFPGNYVERI